MDPIENPYSPGAGSRPPELAGRDELREKVRIALARTRRGNHAKSVLMVGLRGVGKTVLLEQLRRDAEQAGVVTVKIEAEENYSLPGRLVPNLRAALLKLSRTEQAKQLAVRALRALAGFARGLKVKYSDIELAYDQEPEPGLADNGDLLSDLTDLLKEVGRAAQAAETAVVLFIDELQYVREDEFAALITALHQCTQDRLPVTLVGAGLPQLRGNAGNAKSYAERLFDYPAIGPLDPAQAALAIVKPAQEHNADYRPEATAEIIRQTQGYPYFLQEWGKHSWDVAPRSPITQADVTIASLAAVAELDASFFGVRFDRLTPSERRYLRAMAELGPGPHRSGDIAAQLRKPTNSLGPVRASLIAKGMIWSPGHGDTAFTVPLFDDYMRRIMPGDEWRREA